jgi:hypothetical protein
VLLEVAKATVVKYIVCYERHIRYRGEGDGLIHEKEGNYDKHQVHLFASSRLCFYGIPRTAAEKMCAKRVAA